MGSVTPDAYGLQYGFVRHYVSYLLPRDELGNGDVVVLNYSAFQSMLVIAARDTMGRRAYWTFEPVRPSRARGSVGRHFNRNVVSRMPDASHAHRE
jgi:hypothetical protein